MFVFVAILQLVCGLLLSAVILFQSGKNSGLSDSIGGSNSSFLTANKSKTLDAKLTRATKWIGAAFIVLTLALNVLQ